MKNKFFELLEETGKELNHELVKVTFNENSIELDDGFMVAEEDRLIGQEGIKLYNIHEAYDFLNRNGLLLGE